MSKELKDLSDEIQILLTDSRATQISDTEFNTQVIGFMIGNSFDVFSDQNAITEQTARQSLGV
ncbi:MAG: hypothetical protein FD175_602 [Beijerinckiaceae bacterium]|nr:MAG: hypothetical protein FD175_602 [Beijerinckiaceae bacterium]